MDILKKISLLCMMVLFSFWKHEGWFVIYVKTENQWTNQTSHGPQHFQLNLEQKGSQEGRDLLHSVWKTSKMECESSLGFPYYPHLKKSISLLLFSCPHVEFQEKIFHHPTDLPPQKKDCLRSRRFCRLRRQRQI